MRVRTDYGCTVNDLGLRSSHGKSATRATASKPDSRQLDELELAAWRGMLFAYRNMTTAIDERLEREHELSLSSYEVLLLLSRADDNSLRMGELADQLLLSRSGLTRLVDRLVARGLRRAPHLRPTTAAAPTPG